MDLELEFFGKARKHWFTWEWRISLRIKWILITRKVEGLNISSTQNRKDRQLKTLQKVQCGKITWFCKKTNYNIQHIWASFLEHWVREITGSWCLDILQVAEIYDMRLYYFSFRYQPSYYLAAWLITPRHYIMHSNKWYSRYRI